MSAKRKQQFRDLMVERTMVQFVNRWEVGHIRGYIVDVGITFFLVLLVSDGLRFDGFESHRVQDIRKLRPDPYRKFSEAALLARGETVEAAPDIDLTNVQSIVASVSKLMTLVTIQQDSTDPDVCWIGNVEKLSKRHVWLLEIGPDAVWSSSASRFKLFDITQIGWGGEYEQALALVAGNVPDLLAF